VLAENRDLK